MIAILKIMNNSEPEYLAELLKNESRNKKSLIPYLYIREQPKIRIFKKMLKNWIILNITKFMD